MNVSNDLLGASVAVLLALLGVVWGLLRAQNAEQALRIAKLEAQNVDQEKSLTRLQAQMVAREDAHHAHRETMAEQLSAINVKLDRILFGSRGSAGAYSSVQAPPRRGGAGTGSEGEK